MHVAVANVMGPERPDQAPFIADAVTFQHKDPIVMINNWIPFKLKLDVNHEITKSATKTKFNPQRSLLVFSDWQERLGQGKP